MSALTQERLQMGHFNNQAYDNTCFIPATEPHPGMQKSRFLYGVMYTEMP